MGDQENFRLMKKQDKAQILSFSFEYFKISFTANLIIKVSKLPITDLIDFTIGINTNF